MKGIINITIWIISIAGLTVLYGFARESYRSSIIQDMKVSIVRPEFRGFLDENLILNTIYNQADSIVGRQVKHINTHNINTILNKIPWVSSNQICISLDGTLHLYISERQAFLRIFSQKGESFYIDQQGFIFPKSTSFTSRVRIVSGYLHLPSQQKLITSHIQDSILIDSRLHELYTLEHKLRENHFLDALVDQIYINSLGDIELVPKIGKATVLLGNMEMLELKLSNMSHYYKTSASKPEMLDYRTINLKFRNQIVCIKI